MKIVRRYRRQDARHALLRDIAVTCARPFSGNRINNDTHKKHRLGEQDHVPDSFEAIHNELIVRRMQQFAHTDLNFYKPKVGGWKRDTKSVFPMVFKVSGYEHLMSRIHEIEELIRHLAESVNAEITKIDVQL